MQSTGIFSLPKTKTGHHLIERARFILENYIELFYFTVLKKETVLLRLTARSFSSTDLAIRVSA